MPFTRVAVGGLSPLFIGSGRAVVAAVLAASALTLTRQRLPHGRQWVRLAVVGGGVVVGFPLLTSFALTTAPASHGAVVIALLPAATATMAVLRGHERPPVTFWVVAGVGAVAAIGFASAQWGGLRAAALVRPAAVRRGRGRGRRLRRGRAARPRARRLADRVLGAGAVLAR